MAGFHGHGLLALSFVLLGGVELELATCDEFLELFRALERLLKLAPGRVEVLLRIRFLFLENFLAFLGGVEQASLLDLASPLIFRWGQCQFLLQIEGASVHCLELHAVGSRGQVARGLLAEIHLQISVEHRVQTFLTFGIGSAYTSRLDGLLRGQARPLEAAALDVFPGQVEGRSLKLFEGLVGVGSPCDLEVVH